VKNVSTKQSPDANKHSRMDVGISAGLAIGAGFGVALGVALDNIPLGITIGIGCGLSLGVSIGSGLNRRDDAPAAGAVREKGAFALIVIGLILLVATVATVLLVH
jgi:hypothetical protein